jgi:hypothetical protein
MNKHTLLVSLLFVCHFAFGQGKAETAFVLEERDLIPEGIAYDPAEKAFYLSSIYKRKIVKITAAGKASDLIASGADEIEQVLGMKVDARGLLWACNNTPEHDTVRKISNVHVYDLRTKKMVKRFKLEDDNRHLFNDLYITKAGDVFVTDTQAGMIWVVRKDSKTLEEFTKRGSVAFANGITATPDEKFLIVSTGSIQGVVRVNIATKQISSISNDRYMVMGYDGLYQYNNTLIGIQNTFFPESVQKVTLNASCDRAEKIDFLCERDAKFNAPTTGVIVDDLFYFIANSQLLQIIGNKGEIKDPASLEETIIMKIKL